MAAALREDRAITTEAYVQRPDGELRHVIAHPQPMHNENGEVTGAMNVLIDITERKEAEIALLTSEEKFRVLADSMPQFIWTANTAGELNYFSQSVFDYSGFTEERIFKEGWLEIVHPEDREANLNLWMQSIKAGTAFHYEHRFRRHDGEYRWQLSRAVPQKDINGEIQMWVGTSTDIHDRRVFLDELKERVEERTKALTITNENLLKSNAELAQFAYVASHDLQEPLRKIQTFVSRIMDLDAVNLSPRGKDYFERIHRSSNRTQQLIQDLLTFSRATLVEKDFQLTDLNELLDKIKEDIHDCNDQKLVSISSTVLPVIPVISFQFEQLFNNLLSNAIKFSKEGTPAVIHISAEIVDGAVINNVTALPGTLYHKISVNDNGIGFDPQFTDRIFLVFQRLHSKESYEGTGIGLAICKKIVENHNGFIRATGRPGEGATFDIYVPVQIS
jgi:PAS domain S-box-containing protein